LKKVLSISIGSSKRDHTTTAEFLGVPFELSRLGTNGDLEKALQLYRQYDGQVDAFGVGGAEFYLLVNGRRYYFRDARRIRRAVRVSKIGDGNGVKHILGRNAVAALEARGIPLKGKKALKTNAVDRYGLARALVDFGCDVTFGDFMFALGLPIPIRSLRTIHLLAVLILPWITKLPYRWFYPLGEEQEREPSQKFARFYQEAEIIAGDFLQVRDYMISDLSGKIVITNTTTARDVEELQKRGLHILVTSTPRLQGRSFGTNVMEATMLALMDKPQSEVTPEDFVDLIERIPIRPNIEVLN
jgi:hypothetical protein